MDKDKTTGLYVFSFLTEAFLSGLFGYGYYVLPIGIFVPVVFFFERRDIWTSIALTMLSGLVRDLASADAPGVSVVSYLLALLFSTICVRKFGRDSEIWLIIQLTLAVLFENFSRVLVYNYMLQGEMVLNWKSLALQFISALLLGIGYVIFAPHFTKSKNVRGKLKLR